MEVRIKQDFPESLRRELKCQLCMNGSLVHVMCARLWGIILRSVGKKVKQVWVAKAIVINTKEQPMYKEENTVVDPDGFQNALKPIKVRASTVNPIHTGDAFLSL